MRVADIMPGTGPQTAAGRSEDGAADEQYRYQRKNRDNLKLTRPTHFLLSYSSQNKKPR